MKLRALWYLLLAACLGLGGGCAASDPAQIRRDALARAPEDTVAAVTAQVSARRAALVRIRTSQGEKTGVVVRADGLILTCRHGSGPRGTLEDIRFADGRGGVAEVLGSCPDSDLQAMRIRLPDGPFSAMPIATAVTAKDWVFLAPWTPPDRTPALSAGRVNLVDMAGAFGPDHRWRNSVLLIDAPAVSGESGAPIVNARGEIVGIASMAARQGAVALLLAGSLTAIQRQMPALAEGRDVPGITDESRRRATFWEAVGRNGPALWPSAAGQTPFDEQQFRGCLARTRARLETEGQASPDRFTSEQCRRSLSALLEDLSDTIANASAERP